MPVVLPEPSVLKTEDIEPSMSSESMTNGPQTVPPLAVRSVPVTPIVDDLSNMSLNSVNSHTKVFIIIYILFLISINYIFYNNYVFRFRILLHLRVLY